MSTNTGHQPAPSPQGLPRTAEPNQLASHVLILEQKLDAYEKLHAEELEELRQTLLECKRAIVALCDTFANGPAAAKLTDSKPKEELERRLPNFTDVDV